MTAHFAERTPNSIRIWTADDHPRLVTTMRLDISERPADVLRVHGWRLTSRWVKSDDTPAGHKLAGVEQAGGQP